MVAKVILFCSNYNELCNFLNSFFDYNISIRKNTTHLSWEKNFSNPVEISDIIAAFSDNTKFSSLSMWVSFDKNIYIKISQSNANMIIKYIFERYPY